MSENYTVDKNELTEVDVCSRCGKDLRTVKEIHVVEGTFYCSAECAIDAYTDGIIANAREQAKAIYNDFCEVVTPVDIGIVEESEDEEEKN